VSSGSRWRAWASRLRSGRRDDDLDRELGDWVEELAARYEAEGVPAVEARRRAVIETGGVEQVKEAVRDVRPAAALEACLRDARHAWRGLWKCPTFAGVVIATLALGIGATTAIFSVVTALLLTPPPYRDASALVFVWSDGTCGQTHPAAAASAARLRRAGCTRYVWAPPIVRTRP